MNQEQTYTSANATETILSPPPPRPIRAIEVGLVGKSRSVTLRQHQDGEWDFTNRHGTCTRATEPGALLKLIQALEAPRSHQGHAGKPIHDR